MSRLQLYGDKKSTTGKGEESKSIFHFTISEQLHNNKS